MRKVYVIFIEIYMKWIILTALKGSNSLKNVKIWTEIQLEMCMIWYIVQVITNLKRYTPHSTKYLQNYLNNLHSCICILDWRVCCRIWLQYRE